jgi:predicted nuclease of restriction endonuclease-like (RecB) superfamily
MSTNRRRKSIVVPIKRPATHAAASADFDAVLQLIDAARVRAVTAVNTTLIELYWSIGEFITAKISREGWGQGTVKALAEYIQQKQPNARGFSASNLWRMKQFFETYRHQPELATVLRELPWSHHLAIMSRCKRQEERTFYLQMATRENWSIRETQRQLKGALFERVVLSPPKLSPPVREIHPDAAAIFKDSYLVEFLQLPPGHSEADLHRALVEKLKQFLIELGRDFCFIGSEYSIQVGGRDFSLDLLFFNRALNCLVAIELKIEEFEPEHLGKLEFYLEALDRDVRKSHERPSIGVLLCATKDCEVVEYALSRAVSPALVAEYQTRLPDKKVLQAKLHEFYELASAQTQSETSRPRLPRPRGKRPVKKKSAGKRHK